MLLAMPMGEGGGEDFAGGLVGVQYVSATGTYIISSYASGNADGGADGQDYVGRLLGFSGGGGAGTAESLSSYGFGTLAGKEEDGKEGADADGNDLTFDASTGFAGIGNSASDLSASNAGSHLWGGDNSPLSFGDGVPKLKYITGASYDSAANVVTYTCDADLLLEGVSCGDLLPGQ